MFISSEVANELISNFPQLAELPETFSGLSGLKTLDLFNNCLGELPDVIKHLTGLVSLDLDQNGFKLNVMDVPQISHKLTYPDKGTSGGNNWRNRPRQDFIQVDIERVRFQAH